MSQQHDRITRKMSNMGIAWAVRSDKFCSKNDPLEDQIAGRQTYHIHPDAQRPYEDNILRFNSLAEIEGWLKAREQADAAPDTETAWRIMEDFYASLS